MIENKTGTYKPSLNDVLTAVRGGEWMGQVWAGLKLSRIVAYALGGGDNTSRRNFESLGPSMTEPGAKKAKSVWMPPSYAESLGVADAALPNPERDSAGSAIPGTGWGIMSGTRPDGRAFARAWKGDGKTTGPTIEVPRAANETLARLEAVLRARLWDDEQRQKAKLEVVEA